MTLAFQTPVRLTASMSLFLKKSMLAKKIGDGILKILTPAGSSIYRRRKHHHIDNLAKIKACTTNTHRKGTGQLLLGITVNAKTQGSTHNTPTYINIILSVFVDICSFDVGQNTAARAEENKYYTVSHATHFNYCTLK